VLSLAARSRRVLTTRRPITGRIRTTTDLVAVASGMVMPGCRRANCLRLSPSHEQLIGRGFSLCRYCCFGAAGGLAGGAVASPGVVFLVLLLVVFDFVFFFGVVASAAGA
jgi:hypothetical protein